MVDFNKLYITPDGNHLVLDVSVNTGSSYTNVYIDNVKIDTEDYFTMSGPSSTPVYKYTQTGNTKSLVLTLSNSDILANLSDNMLFVYVSTKGVPSSDVPCGMDNQTELACIVDLYKIYQLNLPFLREINNGCCIPKEYIDLILRIKALEIAMKTNNYTMAVQYWKKFFKKNSPLTLQTCGCHG